MKVTFLTPTLELHGGTLVLAQYANRLAEEGHRVRVISPQRGSGTLLHPGIEIVTYPAFPVRFADTLSFQLPYWRRIVRLIEECDIIIPIYTPLLRPALMAKRQKRLSARIVLLGQEAFEMPVIGPYNRFLLSRSDAREQLAHVVAVSEPLAATYRQLVGTDKVTLIPNGIDLSLFKPRKLPREKHLLLFVGRPNAPKGYPLFQQAVRRLRREFPDLRGRVIAPGLTPKEEGGILLRSGSRQELAELYNAATAYVCASTGESFGLPALEAMASGTPVVTTATVGSAQYAADGQNCLVVPVGNADGLCEAIRRLLANPDLAAKLAAAGLKTAQSYSQEKSIQAFSTLVRSLA